MITAGTDLQVLVATRPVDFRKQADGLAAIVQAALGADPFCGQEAGPGEAVVVGRNWHLSDDEAAGEWAVPLAADRRRDDEAVGGAARCTSGRRPVGARGAP